MRVHLEDATVVPPFRRASRPSYTTSLDSNAGSHTSVVAQENLRRSRASGFRYRSALPVFHRFATFRLHSYMLQSYVNPSVD